MSSYLPGGPLVRAGSLAELERRIRGGSQNYNTDPNATLEEQLAQLEGQPGFTVDRTRVHHSPEPVLRMPQAGQVERGYAQPLPPVAMPAVTAIDFTTGRIHTKWGTVELSPADRSMLAAMVARTLKDVWEGELRAVELLGNTPPAVAQPPSMPKRNTKRGKVKPAAPKPPAPEPPPIEG